MHAPESCDFDGTCHPYPVLSLQMCSIFVIRGLTAQTLIPSTPFLDRISPHIPNKAQNGNQGTIQAYSLFLPGHDNRPYWGTFDPLFSDTWYTGAESEITGFQGSVRGMIPGGYE